MLDFDKLLQTLIKTLHLRVSLCSPSLFRLLTYNALADENRLLASSSSCHCIDYSCIRKNCGSWRRFRAYDHWMLGGWCYAWVLGDCQVLTAEFKPDKRLMCFIFSVLNRPIRCRPFPGRFHRRLVPILVHQQNLPGLAFEPV